MRFLEEYRNLYKIQCHCKRVETVDLATGNPLIKL